MEKKKAKSVKAKALAQRFRFACLENCFGFFLSKSYHATLKKKRIGVVYLRAYKATNKIQPQEYSPFGKLKVTLSEVEGVKGQWNRWYIAQTLDSQRQLE